MRLLTRETGSALSVSLSGLEKMQGLGPPGFKDFLGPVSPPPRRPRPALGFLVLTWEV